MMGVKLCLVAGCMNLTAGTRCAVHEKAHQRARNAQPGRGPRRTRAYMDTPIPVGSQCWCCGATEDLTRHHLDPIAGVSATSVRVTLAGRDLAGSGLIPMCRSCNSSIGAKRMAGLTCPKHGGVEA